MTIEIGFTRRQAILYHDEKRTFRYTNVACAEPRATSLAASCGATSGVTAPPLVLAQNR